MKNLRKYLLSTFAAITLSLTLASVTAQAWCWSRPGETSASYAERRVDLLEEAAQNENFTIGRDIAYAKAALATTVQNYSRGWNLAENIEDGSLRNNLK